MSPPVIFQRRPAFPGVLSGIRRRLTAATNFYVNFSTGSPTNDGRSALTPKRQIQEMWDDLQDNYDLAGFQPTINVADSIGVPYTGGVNMQGGLTGAGASPACLIIGNEANPENVTLFPTSSAFFIKNCSVMLAGMKLMSVTGSLIAAYDHSDVTHRNMWFADCGHETFEAHFGSIITAVGPTRKSGTCSSFIHSTEGSQVNFDDQPLNLGSKSQTVTVSIAAPGVVSWTAHGLADGSMFAFTTDGALPTGLSPVTLYYVKAVDADHFQLALTAGGAAITTTGTQSGTHTGVADPPRGESYIFGINRATVAFERAPVTGTFVTVPVTHASRMGIHFLGLLNLTSTTGVDGFFPAGQSLLVVEKLGRIVYGQDIDGVSAIENTIYYRPDANGDHADGYANTVARAFKTSFAAIQYLAHREPDAGFGTPVIQVQYGTPGSPVTHPGFALADIPGVAKAILRGNPADPSTCKIVTTGSSCAETTGTQTQWLVDGFEISSSSGVGLSALQKGNIQYQNIRFGVCATAHISANYDAYVEDSGPNEIIGDAPSHLQMAGGKARITKAMTITGARTFTNFAALGEGSTARVTSVYTGPTPTGSRYSLTGGASLTRGADTLPGATAGTCDLYSYTDMVHLNRTFDLPPLVVGGAGLSLTGTLTKTALTTFTVPANVVGLNGKIVITTIWTFTNNANIKTPFIEYGSNNYLPTTWTTEQTKVVRTEIQNINSASSQRGGSDGANAALSASSANNGSGATTITISAQLANVGDTVTLRAAFVTIHSGF